MQVKNKLYLFWNILFALTVVYFVGCSEPDEPTPEPEKVDVKIEADKSTIKANGSDSVKFTVTANEAEVDTDVRIFLKDDPNALPDMSFAVKDSGVYTFYAVYDGIKSTNEINVEATNIPISLSADKKTIKANNRDTTVFTVTADGKDVTADAIFTLMENPDFVIADEASFFTKEDGSYTFYATYDNKKSNEIIIDASEVQLILAADRSTIKANNSDKVTFIVTADGENVTADAEFFLQDGTGVEDLPFFTDVAGSHTFYAVYDGEKTNEVVINATYVALEFQMQYCIMQVASTICPNCPRFTNEIQKAIAWNKNIFNVIVLHPYGRICTSELSGALASTANQLAELTGANTPPVGLVDLHRSIWLYPTTTQYRMEQELNNSTVERGRNAETGIAIRSNVNNGNIDFTVNVKSNNTNKYRFFAFVVEDGIINRQQSVDENGNQIRIDDYVHNSVATYMLEGEDPLTGVSLGTIQPGEEITQTYSIQTANFNTKRVVNLDNCRIVAYTLREINGRYCIDNVTNCPVNGTVRYKYK